MGASTQRLLKGATAVILGKSTLQKADRGWRVMDAIVTASKILPPPDAPSEGRSTEIQPFFTAFKQALASHDTHAVAKFVRFPLQFGVLICYEPQFHAQFPLGADQIQVITETKVLDQRQNGSYGIHTGGIDVEFQKDRDGYWKWTEFSYTEGEGAE